MKKKPTNTNNKDHQQRVKTPDISSIKRKPNKPKKVTDTTTKNNATPQISTNLQKKAILKSSINSSTKNEIKQPKKTKFTLNKEKKEDQTVKNPTSDLVKEERPNSASKKLFKNKKAKIEEKKEKQKTHEIMNKTGDNFYKPKIAKKNNNAINNNNTINNNIDKQRRKSVDITLDRKNKKTEKTKNDKSLKLSIKPDKIKKTLNKTTDNKKIKNHKKANKKENDKDIKKNIETIPVSKVEDKSKEKKEDKKVEEIKKKESKDIKDKENNQKNIGNKTSVENIKTKVEEEKKDVVKKEEKKPEIKSEIKKEEKKELKKEEKKEEQKEEKKEEKKVEDKKDVIEKEKLKEKTETKVEEKKEKKEINIKMNYIFMRSNKFSSNYTECLYLGLNSGFFDPVQKLKIMLNSKELYDNLDKKKLISELIKHYTKLGNKNLQKENKTEYDIVKVKSLFNPKERSLNSLNFIDKEEENKLMNELQHPYITDYFKLILILLNEKYDQNKNIFEFFFKDLLQKHNAKDIKNLFIKQFINSEILINDEQFNMIQKMIIIKPDLLSPATLLRYNRAVAYSAFFLKDLFNYLNLKTPDGKYYYQLRINSPKNEYEEKINKLKLLL